MKVKVKNSERTFALKLTETEFWNLYAMVDDSTDVLTDCEESAELRGGLVEKAFSRDVCMAIYSALDDKRCKLEDEEWNRED